MNETQRLLELAYTYTKRAGETMMDEYPIGTWVRYRHGGQKRRGKVCDHNPYCATGPRIRVQTINGSDGHWLDIHRLFNMGE